MKEREWRNVIKFTIPTFKNVNKKNIFAVC